MLNEVCSLLPEEDVDYSVIELDKNYKIAESDRILVAPTLVISSPQPVKRIISGLNDREKILSVLGITDNYDE
jgi:hypothetical protein